jgi:hypothetical protein
MTKRTSQPKLTRIHIVVASVWLVHGVYNKLLGGSPRHLAIVQSIPGLYGATGELALTIVGAFEVLLAAWVLSRRAPRACAAAQTVALLSMNAIELTFARHLLLWPAGLVPVNLAFLALAWTAAGTRPPWNLRARLRRHPIPIKAHFDQCLTLTYALPADALRPLLPPGLELDELRGHGFVAVALVQTRSLRPAGFPQPLGQDFFLAGYRVFVKFRTPDGRTLRGLRILRSDTNERRMVVGGNLLTHYNYHRCDAMVDATARDLSVVVRTPDGRGDIDLTASIGRLRLPIGSPFQSVREARHYAGPLRFTFDYEPETHAMVAIEATRTNWKPTPVDVDVRRMSFLDDHTFGGVAPILASAFQVNDIEYRWERGVHYTLNAQPQEAAS